MQFVDYFAATMAVGGAVTYGLQKMFSEVDFVRSSVDSRRYLVQDLPDKAAAADHLARINTAVQTLILQLQDAAKEDERVRLLAMRYNPDNVSEGSPQSGYTSYSVNKGEKLVVCIRQKDGSFADMNDVTYVVVHELAHLATDEIGHTPKFWENFRFLLQHAVGLGLYEYRDYKRAPAPYCGINISSTVLRDGIAVHGAA